MILIDSILFHPNVEQFVITFRNCKMRNSSDPISFHKLEELISSLDSNNYMITIRFKKVIHLWYLDDLLIQVRSITSDIYTLPYDLINIEIEKININPNNLKFILVNISGKIIDDNISLSSLETKLKALTNNDFKEDIYRVPIIPKPRIANTIIIKDTSYYNGQTAYYNLCQICSQIINPEECIIINICPVIIDPPSQKKYIKLY